MAITRVRRLQDLFVSAIFPTFWKKIADTPDIDRRQSEMALRQASADLAEKHGMYAEMRDELDWRPDYGDVDEEWRELQRRTTVPVSRRLEAVDRLTKIPNGDLWTMRDDGARAPICLNAVTSERHIGLDQGRRHFATAVVDQVAGGVPQLHYASVCNLELPKKFTAADALSRLMRSTNLMTLMQQRDPPAGCTGLPRVDRVIVHLEQMSTKNANWKQLGPELGKELQRHVADVTTCIVKMSQPNVHRASGPMFKLGERVVKELQLEPATYGKKRKSGMASGEASTSSGQQGGS